MTIVAAPEITEVKVSNSTRILLKAADDIETNGLAKEHWFFHGMHCAVGAISQTTNDTPFGHGVEGPGVRFNEYDTDDTDVLIAIDRVVAYLHTHFPCPSGGDCTDWNCWSCGWAEGQRDGENQPPYALLSDWSELEQTTAQDVVAALRGAALS